MFTGFIFFLEIRASYEIMCEKYCRKRQGTDGNLIWRMRFECSMIKTTNTHSELCKGSYKLSVKLSGFTV